MENPSSRRKRIILIDKGKNMKKLLVSRKKAFAGSLLPYWIIVGFSKDIFIQKYNFDGDLCEMSALGRAISRINIEELDRIGTRIKNGQTLEISVADNVNYLFVSTMDGCLSNEINIEDCLKINEGRITINTKGGLKNLSYPVVEIVRLPYK